MSQRRQPTPSYAQKCYTKLETAPFVLQAETTMSNNKILVVEDDADYREMIMLFLLRSSYEGVEAATGFEAVSQARVTRPNLILMDLDMPAMTGDQATARLKADPSTRNIPVIVTTAFSYGPHVDRAIAFGAAEVLYKPFHLKSLHAMLQRHLSVDREPSQPDPLGPSRPSILSFRHRDRFLRPTKRPGA